MDLGLVVAETTNDDEALASIVRALKADSGTIHLIGDDGMLHLAAATPGFPEALLRTISVIPVGKGMAGLAVERREPVDACNIQTDTTGDVRPGALSTGLAGAVVVPIFRGQQVIGSLGVANRAARTFADSEVDELLTAGRAIASMHPEAHAAPG
jgi:signal transduction protein with GAF and PtsI domain